MVNYKIIRSGNNLEIYQYEKQITENATLEKYNEKRYKYSVLKSHFSKHVDLLERCEQMIENGVDYSDILHKIRLENAHMVLEFAQLDKYFQDLKEERLARKNDVDLQHKRRKQTLRDNSNNLKRIIRENFGQYAFMLTLTYSDRWICTKKDIEKSDRRVKSLFKKLKDYGYEFKYVGVRELQKKRGAIHYHYIIEDEDFYKQYVRSGSAIKDKKKNAQHKQFENLFHEEFWKFGFVDIRHIDGIDDTGAYIAKYLMKANVKEMEWLENRRLVLRSKGIKKVSPTKDEDTIEKLGEKVEYIKSLAYKEALNNNTRKKVFTNSYGNKYTGATVYYEVHFDRLEDSEKKMLQSLFE